MVILVHGVPRVEFDKLNQLTKPVCKEARFVLAQRRRALFRTPTGLHTLVEVRWLQADLEKVTPPLFLTPPKENSLMGKL